MGVPISDCNAYPLQFSVRKSIAYHARRRAWFDALHLWTMLIATLSATSAFVSIVEGYPEIAKCLSLMVAAISLMDIIFKWPEKARDHDILYRRFHELLQGIIHELGKNENEGYTLSSQRLAKFQNQKLMIEDDEPTSIDVLNVMCHNIQAQAEGHAESEMYRIKWYQRLMCQICTLPPNDFRKKC